MPAPHFTSRLKNAQANADRPELSGQQPCDTGDQVDWASPSQGTAASSRAKPFARLIRAYETSRYSPSALSSDA